MAEDRHSDLLLHCLDPRALHGLSARLLLAIVGIVLPRHSPLCGRVLAAGDGFAVRRERRGARSRIDLQIEGPDFLVHIENKRLGGETDHPSGVPQTVREWEDLVAAGRRRLLNEDQILAIYLSPSGRPPSSPRFHPVSWADLADALLDLADGSSPPDVSAGLRQWATALYRTTLLT